VNEMMDRAKKERIACLVLACLWGGSAAAAIAGGSVVLSGLFTALAIFFLRLSSW